jgi:hypothetical protein
MQAALADVGELGQAGHREDGQQGSRDEALHQPSLETITSALSHIPWPESEDEISVCPISSNSSSRESRDILGFPRLLARHRPRHNPDSNGAAVLPTIQTP